METALNPHGEAGQVRGDIHTHTLCNARSYHGEKAHCILRAAMHSTTRALHASVCCVLCAVVLRE
eukprot:1968348-Rhodomonas_salina.7